MAPAEPVASVTQQSGWYRTAIREPGAPLWAPTSVAYHASSYLTGNEAQDGRITGERPIPQTLAASIRSMIARFTPSTGTRSWAIESRSRTVTAMSSSDSTSTVTHHGVPISSWRR